VVIDSHIKRQLEFLKEKAPPGFKYRQMDDLGCGDGKVTLLLKEIPYQQGSEALIFILI